MDDPDAQPPEEIEPRPPTLSDLVSLCRHLNEAKAEYVVIGGFAIIQTGYPRFTGDIDLLVSTKRDNESKVLTAMASLPDGASNELEAGEIAEYNVIRVADEIVVDLMGSACGYEYEELAADILHKEIDGVKIPFASPVMLWKLKQNTHREKDAMDIAFLKQWFEENQQELPS